MNWFWWNFPQIIWQIYAKDLFRGFWNFEFDDVIAAILHLRVAALSRSQFWSDFLQNLGQGTIKSCIVWYWKSARSINNFRSKKRTAFESHRCFGFRAELWGRGFESQRGQIFLFVIMNVFSFEISPNRLRVRSKPFILFLKSLVGRQINAREGENLTLFTRYSLPLKHFLTWKGRKNRRFESERRPAFYQHRHKSTAILILEVFQMHFTNNLLLLE